VRSFSSPHLSLSLKKSRNLTHWSRLSFLAIRMVYMILPISPRFFRRGMTATPPQLDYCGRPTFLIDASVFGGSSGSPVFLDITHARGPSPIRVGIDITPDTTGSVHPTSPPTGLSAYARLAGTHLPARAPMSAAVSGLANFRPTLAASASSST
jgi:hypothetical protein